MSEKINNTIKSVAYALSLDERWLYENLERLRQESARYVEAKEEKECGVGCKCSCE